ncbi:hypothetical protein [Mycolicibacterium sp.]|uniref:hypothetical protein n=1 Tax=Mycolicibacterium sp. TaxID=2320850 RepID=UPI003D12D5E1
MALPGFPEPGFPVSIARHVAAAAVAAAAVAAPLLIAGLGAPVTATAQCPPGETGVIYGCAPFCVPGKALDLQTGLCLPVAPPPAPPAPRV